MKKTYLPVSFRRYGQKFKISSHTLLTVILMIAGFGTATLQAQNCALSCQGAQISLDENCQAEVTYQMLADTSQCLSGQYSVYVMTAENDTIPTSPFVTEAEIGMTLKASVYDHISQNSCWAWITVEDKLPPQLECACEPVTEISGVIADTDPVWNRPVAAPDGSGCVLSLVGTNVYYDTWEFSITEAGMYTFTAEGPFDGVGVMYLGAFDPTDPCTNIIGYDDDGGPGLNPMLSLTLSMVAGDYTLVTSTFANGVTGAYTWDISGPGDIVQDISQCIERCSDIDINHPFPVATDNCTDNVDVVLLNEETEALCHPLFIKKLTRWYTAFDERGNQSDTCKQVFFLERLDFGDITWPDSFTVSGGDPFLCDEAFADADGDGCPDAVPVAQGGAGVPTIDGVPVYPDFMFYCNAQIAVEDVPIGPIGCVKKTMRIWTAYEWHCSGERDTIYVQLIEVVDQEGPVLTCPADITVSTDFHDCDATVHLPVPLAVDNCNDVDQITAQYPGGFVDNVTGNIYLDLEVGENVITYTAYDECYNSSQCEWRVTVEDKTPPVPVCDEHTIVSLTNSGPYGLTKVAASVFDDGSYDECGPVTFLARRMDSCIDFDWTTEGAGIDEIPDGDVDTRDRGMVFRPKVPFACCDVGAGPIMIALEVTDASGNKNTCMVEVEVQDKIGPYIECPNDITISCTFDYDMDNLDIFGTVETNEDDRDEICIFDPENPAANGEGFTCWGIDGFAWDNCDVEVNHSATAYINSCGIGYIERIFTATDPGGRVVSCPQRIYIENFDPFWINPENPNDPTDDVIWPQSPYEAFGCGNNVEPEVTGFPVFNEDECDLIGYTYEDQIFPFVQGACFKILRTWEVIDWCQFEPGSQGPGGYSGYWTFPQVIKVTNTEAPEFLTTQPDISECNEFNCDALFIDIVQEAEDDCTPDDELVWEFGIDVDNNGSVDIQTSGTGNVIDASGNYPIGSHRFIYTFEDKCGNKTTKEQFVEILACKPPSPICLNGLSADLMPVDSDGDGEVDWGMITIWASDFDKGSYHACGYDVVVSFSPDTNDVSMIFDCDDVGPEPTIVQLWVTDVVLGQQDYCETYIIIQDNLDACPGTNTGTGIISGVISTEFTETVKEVEVALNGSGIQPVTTSSNGNFSFPQMPYGGTYEVKPAKNNDWMNGVSTLDLVKIQKHLLGIESLDSPYKRIAADANKSDGISAVDILELRKLILGIYSELPNNTSWRFVESDYTFIDPANPFAENFPESYMISPFSANMLDVNFVGIKIGDVNETVQANAQGVEIRNGRDNYYLTAEDVQFEAGQTVDLAVTAENFDKMLGYQFTLNYDQNLVLEQIVPGALAVDNNFFGLQNADRGVITASWSSAVPKAVDANTVLFTLQFKTMGAGVLSKSVFMSSDRAMAEAYDVSDRIFNLDLRFDETQQTHDYALFQNTPNPYTDETVIGFTMAEAGNAKVTVFDVQGKVLYQTEIQAQAGYNSVTLRARDLSATGVMYYQLESNGFTATRKMIKM